MTLKTDPVSGRTYGSIYESDKLKVNYVVGREGPKVTIYAPLCAYGSYGNALAIPRDEWDRMLEALALA